MMGYIAIFFLLPPVRLRLIEKEKCFFTKNNTTPGMDCISLGCGSRNLHSFVASCLACQLRRRSPHLVTICHVLPPDLYHAHREYFH